MGWRSQARDVREKCYPAQKPWQRKALGVALLAAGALTILLCVPCWAWTLALGLLLLALGYLLVR